MTESGLVVVDKPAGITSHDVVARVRRLAGTRKVGHAGTLDPMATGVLVLGLNRATRLLGHLTLTDKAYAATVRLGMTTTTDDAEGEVVDSQPTDGLTETAVRDALAAFVGEIDQVPSAVSAIKIDGKRAYARVRDGEQVDLPARRVSVHSIDVVSTSLDRRDQPVTLDIEVRCSSGTYIRAIARDLGAALGVGGHLTALRRTAVGPFLIDEARTLDALADDFTRDAHRRRGPEGVPGQGPLRGRRRARPRRSRARPAARRADRRLRPGRHLPRALRAEGRRLPAGRRLRLRQSADRVPESRSLSSARADLAVVGRRPG